MWHWNKPSASEVGEFIVAQQALPYSYCPVGASDSGSPAGFNLDHHRVRIGQGALDFEAAVEAVRAWKMFPNDWIVVRPADTKIEAGTTLAVLARAFGLWWLAASRIVYVIDESTPIRRFGFAYGTLPVHMEVGEERFLVEQDPDGTVWYDVRAYSRPSYWMTRLGYPLTRRLQRRFFAESQQGMQEAVAAATDKSSHVGHD